MKKNLKIISYFLLLGVLGCSKSATIEKMVKMEVIQGPSGAVESDLSGVFVDGAHPTSGMASINKAHTQLSLTNFKTDDGPLLEMYLASDVQATDYISLGVLKGLDGNYSYDLPANLDFGTYKYVMVWCVDFSIDFGHAILE